MENTAILTSLLRWFFPGGCITSRIVFVWLFLVVVFAGYGFIHSGNQLRGDSFSMPFAVEGAILTGGLGVGIATCVTGGLMILANLQANRFGKGTAILHLFTCTLVSTVSTPASIVLARPVFPKAWNLFNGEGFMGIAFVSWWMGIVAITVFLLLAITVILSSHQPTDDNRDP
jgi:hypothetical protein